MVLEQLHMLHQQRESLARCNMVLSLKPFLADPQFEKHSLKIINRLNEIFVKNNELLPFTSLSYIIQDYIREDVYKPPVNYTILRKAYLPNIGECSQSTPLHTPSQSTKNMQKTRTTSANDTM